MTLKMFESFLVPYIEITIFLRRLFMKNAAKFTATGITMLTFLLTGCAGMGTDQTVGTVAGSAVGLGLGSLVGGGAGRTAAMIVGAGLGGLAGSTVGKSIDQTNKNSGQ